MTDNGSRAARDMTKREDFAKTAMQGICAAGEDPALEYVAQWAVKGADALLAALGEDGAGGEGPRESRVRGHVVVEIGKMSTSILPADTLYLSSGKIVLAGPNHAARAETLARAIRVACGEGGA